MSRMEQLRKRRKEILAELEQMEEFRRGSVVEQYEVATRKDGSQVKRGPYVLYSYKDKGKTVSRRLTDPEQVPLYREQIERFRRFQRLTGELRAIGEEMCELTLREPGVKKTLKPRSKSKKMPR